MTIKEAIKILDPETTQEALAACCDKREMIRLTDEACETACAVLRALDNSEHLRELVEAEKDGRLVVLPVKLGTQVWSSVFCKVNEDGTESPTYPWNFDISMMNEWGQGWHLTREEAETALKEREQR